MAERKFKRPEILCPSCQKANSLGHAFCISCGVRLYQASGAPPNVNTKKSGGAGRAMVNGVRALCSFVLVATLGLALWPQETAGTRGDSADEIAGLSVLRGFSSANRGGESVQLTISERQINAVLEGYAEEWVTDADSRKYGKRYPVEMKAEIGEGEIMLTALERFGPLNLSARVCFGIDPEEKAWLSLRAYQGHLPLPAKLAPMIAERVAQRFDLHDEISLMEQIHPLKTKKGVIALNLRPAAEK